MAFAAVYSVVRAVSPVDKRVLAVADNFLAKSETRTNKQRCCPHWQREAHDELFLMPAALVRQRAPSFCRGTESGDDASEETMVKFTESSGKYSTVYVSVFLGQLLLDDFERMSKFDCIFPG